MSHKGKPSEMHRKNKRREPSRREEGLVTTREHMISAQNRAQKIFMTLVEENASPETFAELLRHINPDTYEQITMDRGASGICGYPLCPNEFVDTYGDQLFKIRNNKVYEISFRRNFCSDVCYEASEIVREQVSVEPLYLRDNLPEKALEVKIPEREKLRGRHGKMIDITGGLNIPYKSHAKQTRSFTSFTEVAEDSLAMCAENKEEYEELSGKKKAGANKDSSDKKDKSEASGESKQENTGMDTDENKTFHKWRQTEDDRGHLSNQHFDTQMAVLEIEQAFREWMSFESLRLILGDQFVKGMLEDFGANWEDYESTEGLKLGVEAKAKYIALCRKLDEEEYDERCEPDLETLEVRKLSKQPLPDYQQLQEDAIKQKLKVVSFLGGQDQFDVSAEQKKKSKEEDVNISLPLIDSFSQVQWRQSIVLDKFEKYMKPFLALANLDESKVQCLIKDMVVTFNFSANNIIFKPGQWNFVTLLVLKMLSIRIPAIRTGMEMEEFQRLQGTLLLSFSLDEGYLDRFLCYITEIKHIIRRSDSKEEHNNQETFKNHNYSLQEDALAGSFTKMDVIVEEKNDENKTNADIDNRESGTKAKYLASDHIANNYVSSRADDLD